MSSKAPKNGKRSEKKQTTIPARATTAKNAPVTTRSSTSTVEAKPAEVSRQAVAEAAYYLWLQRGGNETVNWLEAEAALRRKASASQRVG
jgi:hypothetical protein